MSLRETTRGREAQVPNRAFGIVPTTAGRRVDPRPGGARVDAERAQESGFCGKATTTKMHSFSIHAVASSTAVAFAARDSCDRQYSTSESRPRDANEHPEGASATSRPLGWCARLPLLEVFGGQVPQGYGTSFPEPSGSPSFRIYDAPAINAIGASGK